MAVLKWYHFDQNNSGGFFINNQEVGEDVFIQASSAQEAQVKFGELDNEADNWCECCGERWSGCEEQDDLSLYEKPLSKGYSPYGSSSHAVVYYADGRKDFVKPF